MGDTPVGRFGIRRSEVMADKRWVAIGLLLMLVCGAPRVAAESRDLLSADGGKQIPDESAARLSGMTSYYLK